MKRLKQLCIAERDGKGILGQAIRAPAGQGCSLQNKSGCSVDQLHIDVPDSLLWVVLFQPKFWCWVFLTMRNLDQSHSINWHSFSGNCLPQAKLSPFSFFPFLTVFMT